MKADDMKIGRILWNKRSKSIDEIVAVNPKVVHIEQMDDRCWWIGITMSDGSYWAGDFIVGKKGRLRFVEQEQDGLVWDEDRSHEDWRP